MEGSLQWADLFRVSTLYNSGDEAYQSSAKYGALLHPLGIRQKFRG